MQAATAVPSSSNLPFIPRRSTAAAIVAVIRNPLQALPPQVFTERVVFAKRAGKTHVYLTDPVLIHEALVGNADALSKGENVRRALGPASAKGFSPPMGRTGNGSDRQSPAHFAMIGSSNCNPP